MPPVRMEMSNFFFNHLVSIQQILIQHLWAKYFAKHQRYGNEEDRCDIGPHGATTLCSTLFQKLTGVYYYIEASFFSKQLHSFFLSQHTDPEKYPCIW